MQFVLAVAFIECHSVALHYHQCTGSLRVSTGETLIEKLEIDIVTTLFMSSMIRSGFGNWKYFRKQPLERLVKVWVVILYQNGF
jgi:hypothetical protein